MSDSAVGSAPSLALGRCDEMRAEVFVSVATPAAGPPPRISGTIAGPRRGRDTTLPATARLQPTSTPGLARAIVTEPAYWTPDLPNLYRLEATVERGDALPVSSDRLVGLRRLGVRGRSLWLDGHRWVPRGITATGHDDLAACKAANVAAVIDDPDERTLTRADELGVAVIAVLATAMQGDLAAIATHIAAWAAHPSTAVAILPCSIDLDTADEIAVSTRERRGTMLLAAPVSGTAPPPASLPPGIDALVITLDADTTPHDGWRGGASVPLLAWRGGHTSPATGRAPCDALQAALAGWGTAGGRDTLAWDWAGYIVGSRGAAHALEPA